MTLQIRETLTKSKNNMYALIGVVILFILWCILTYGGFVKPLFLASPTEVLRGMSFFMSKGWLIPAIERSFCRVLVALLLVSAIGIPIGILMAAFSPLNAMFRPILNGAKAVPPTALVGLIILWFSIEEKAKVVFLFLGSIFYLVTLVINAILSVREDYMKVGRDLGMKPQQLIWKVLIPGAMPQIWEAITVANGIMWTYIILAEFINSSEEQIGLGYLLQIGSRTFQSGQVYATVILIGCIAFLSDQALDYVKKRYLAW